MIPIIQLGTISLPTYYLVISLSLCLLLYWLSKRVTDQKKPAEHAFNIALLMMLSAFWGGRLMHVLYENFNYYLENPLAIFYFWNGGFAFYGGLILCFITGATYISIKKLVFLEWADFFTPLFSLSHALGRVGCLLAGCCFGKYCNLPWSVEGRHPTALYLALGEFCIFLFLYYIEKKKIYKTNGTLFLNWIILHSLLRFNVEFFRDDFRGNAIGNFSVSQVISILIFAAAVILVSYKRKISK